MKLESLFDGIIKLELSDSIKTIGQCNSSVNALLKEIIKTGSWECIMKK